VGELAMQDDYSGETVVYRFEDVYRRPSDIGHPEKPTPEPAFSEPVSVIDGLLAYEEVVHSCGVGSKAEKVLKSLLPTSVEMEEWQENIRDSVEIERQMAVQQLSQSLAKFH